MDVTVMGLTIHREPQPDKLIRMGHAAITIAVPVDLTLQLSEPAKNTQPTQPPIAKPEKNKRGRPKKMADEEKLGHETGVKTISEEDPGKQGPVGTSGEKPPAGGPDEDLTIGDTEGEKNG